MKILDELTKLGIELTDEQKKSVTSKFTEEVISVNEHSKKLNKVESERDQLKSDYDTAKATLEGFEGKDFEKLTAEVAEWKKKAEESEKDYQAKLSARDYSDAIKELTKDLKFTSNSAKKAFMADLEANPLQMREGKVLGFDDYVKNYQETDKDAFVTKADENKAKFTEPQINEGGSGSVNQPTKMPLIF